VIEKDKCFASLLQKIKNAYGDYLSELQGRTTRKEEIYNTDLENEKQKNADLEKELRELKISLN
jgi:N12 class adenine-specific DNA methylase